MQEKALKLKQLIGESGRILVISHISPDPDALCSLLLIGTTLKRNFPDKRIVMSAEELTSSLDFLSSYGQITQQPLNKAVEDLKPNLIIIVDAMNFSRCTRGETGPIQSKIKQLGTNLAIIDHHEPVSVEANEVYINNGSPAATQDVYETLFEQIKFERPDGFAETALLGIISDTNRFMYNNPRYRDTFRVVSELLAAGASIEELENKLSRHTKDEMDVLAELSANITIEDGYTYSFISDDFRRRWVGDNRSADNFKLGCETFVSDYIRNIAENYWGFIVYPDLSGSEGSYAASFRSLTGIKDVSQIAKELGGGGHKPAAGAKFKSPDIQAAIYKVKKAIGEN